MEETPTGEFNIKLFEANEPGFAGLFNLNQWVQLPNEKLKNKALLECHFWDHCTKLRWWTNHLFPPLVWSIKSQQFIKGSSQEILLENGDMIFLYNRSLMEQFESEHNLESWFSRVLRHFAEDGLETHPNYADK